MVVKNSNPMKDALSSLQYLLMLTPPEVRQQAIRASSVIKTSLDNLKTLQNNYAVIEGQNQVLRQQLEALKAELSSVQFALPEADAPEEKKRGRKPNVNG
jgi:hypothetical protein